MCEQVKQQISIGYDLSILDTERANERATMPANIVMLEFIERMKRVTRHGSRRRGSVEQVNVGKNAYWHHIVRIIKIIIRIRMAGDNKLDGYH